MFASLGNSCRSLPHRGLVPDRAWPNSQSWLKLYRCHRFSIPTVILLIIPSAGKMGPTIINKGQLIESIGDHTRTFESGVRARSNSRGTLPADGIPPRPTRETAQRPVRALEARKHQGQCNVFRNCLDVRFLVKASFRPDNACQAISRSAPTPRLGEYEKPCRSLCIPRKPAHRTNSGDWVAQIGEPKLGALVCRLTQYRLVPRGSDLTTPKEHFLIVHASSFFLNAALLLFSEYGKVEYLLQASPG
jgi:hypothetical protein